MCFLGYAFIHLFDISVRTAKGLPFIVAFYIYLFKYTNYAQLEQLYCIRFDFQLVIIRKTKVNSIWQINVCFNKYTICTSFVEVSYDQYLLTAYFNLFK